MDDREVVAKIAAGDPAGTVEAYDSYAAGLYGYCNWKLRSPADAAESLRDIFVLAAAALGDLPEASRLRPWLYALARNECRRRLRTSARAEETAAADQRAGAGQQAAAAPQQTDPAYQLIDATISFRAIRQPIGTADLPNDATISFRAIRQPIGTADLPNDATMPFHAIRQPIVVNREPAQTDLPTQVRAILAELKPRDREVIELYFRHGLDDTDLAIVLGVSWSKAHALVSRARGRLEDALAALLVARTGREACPQLDTLLTEWDGQLTEKTRDLLSGHIETCENCSARKAGAVRPTAISELLPLAEPPPGLREQVLMMCFSTAPDAVAYRRRAVRHAESLWYARFLPTFSLIWRNSSGEPRLTAATMAMAAWVVVVWVVLMTLLILIDPKLLDLEHANRAFEGRRHDTCSLSLMNTSGGRSATIEVVSQPGPGQNQVSAEAGQAQENGRSTRSSPPVLLRASADGSCVETDDDAADAVLAGA